MVLNPESPGTGGHQRVCLGSKRFFFFFFSTLAQSPVPRSSQSLPGDGSLLQLPALFRRGPAGSEDPATPGRCRAHRARPRARPRLLP